MCRYAFYKYKNTYACFRCQVGFKRRNIDDVQRDLANTSSAKGYTHDAKCPNCGEEMANVGRDLRLPPKTKDEQWRCIKYLVDHKYNIYSCGCQGIGFVPHKMQDAIDLVTDFALKAITHQKATELQQKQEALAKVRKKRANEQKTKKLLRNIKQECKDETM
jgi:hypothetical protein